MATSLSTATNTGHMVLKHSGTCCQRERCPVHGMSSRPAGPLRAHLKANRRRFSTPVAMHLTVRDGQITRLHLYEDTQSAADAIGSV